MTKKSITGEDNVFSFWEKFKLETLNQKIGRIVLSVHKKSSRLAVLGELGRYPLFIKGLCHVLQYQAQLNKIGNSQSIIGKAVEEMRTNSGNSNITWWAE